MSGSVAYLDTLALPKLVISEPESPALLTSILRWPDRAAAALLRSEAIGALGGLDNTQPSARLDNSSEPFGLLTSMTPCSTGPANSAPWQCARWKRSIWQPPWRSAPIWLCC